MKSTGTNKLADPCKLDYPHVISIKVWDVMPSL